MIIYDELVFYDNAAYVMYKQLIQGIDKERTLAFLKEYKNTIITFEIMESIWNRIHDNKVKAVPMYNIVCT